jgi:hypothetical protein
MGFLAGARLALVGWVPGLVKNAESRKMAKIKPFRGLRARIFPPMWGTMREIVSVRRFTENENESFFSRNSRGRASKKDDTRISLIEQKRQDLQA